MHGGRHGRETLPPLSRQEAVTFVGPQPEDDTSLTHCKGEECRKTSALF